MADEEQELSPEMRQALEQARRSNAQDDAEFPARSRDDFRRVEIPPAIARYLPPGTELQGTVMHTPELGGGYSTGHWLRMSVPFGQTRAQITFDN